MNLVSLVVHGMSAMSVHTDMIFVRVLLGASVIVALSAAGIVGVVAVRFATDLAVPGWATTAVGVLLIILFQAFVTVIATSLSMLAGRINRPIIPVVDCRLFISRREFWRHGHTRTEMASQSRI